MVLFQGIRFNVSLWGYASMHIHRNTCIIKPPLSGCQSWHLCQGPAPYKRLTQHHLSFITSSHFRSKLLSTMSTLLVYQSIGQRGLFRRRALVWRHGLTAFTTGSYFVLTQACPETAEYFACVLASMLNSKLMVMKVCGHLAAFLPLR